MASRNRIQAAVFAALALMTFSVPVEVGASNEQNDVFQYKIYDKGQQPPGQAKPSVFTLTEAQRERLDYAASYWSGLIGSNVGAKRPALITVGTVNDYNAGAFSSLVKYDSQENKLTRLQGYLQGLDTSSESVAIIQIGDEMFPPTAVADDYFTPLPQAEKTGLAATIIHELGHALGISSSLPAVRTSSATKVIFPTDGIANWDAHIYDWRGVQAQVGMEVKRPGSTVTGDIWFDLPNYVNSEDTANFKAPYFSGEHVQELLGTTALQVYNIYGKKMDQTVNGIPLTGAEGNASSSVADLSHLELRNSLMSHQKFRNYNTFIEAELAVMQDIGYTIDRRAYFGHSVYENGLTLYNANPYAARNATGTAYVDNTYNNTDFGMGLHIYGSNNTIYQEADLLTNGAAGVGIRVDGVANTVSVEPGVRVYADGLNGNGLLVAYGSAHNITIQNGGIVQALGEKGIGAAFDFGTNLLEVKKFGGRGSYAQNSVSYGSDTDKVLNQLEINGPLVDTFTVYGKLSGTKAAIYISDNAYVKNVIIGSGAELQGDILNEWLYDFKDLSAIGMGDMARQYTGTEDLTTSLVFTGNALSYGGNITGQKNTRFTIATGDLTYTGTAQALSATVEEAATMYGNATFDLQVPTDITNHTLNYALTFMDKDLTGVGLFNNHGLVVLTTGNITIKGDFVSDGTLGLVTTTQGTKANQLAVSGTAAVTGTKLIANGAMSYLPQTTYTFLVADKGISGTFATQSAEHFTSLLSIDSLQAQGTKATVSLSINDNIGNLNSAQQSVYNNLANLYTASGGNAEQQEQLGYLLGITESEKGRTALSSLTGSARPNAAAMTMRDTGVYDAILTRGAVNTEGGQNGSSMSNVQPLELGGSTISGLR